MNVPVVTGEVPAEITLPRYGIVPRTIQEAIQLAELMATAKLVPAGLQKSPADCLMVIQQAIRWDMDPFAVAQECSVIQGKLMHSGKLVAAVVNARGNLTQRLKYIYSGEGDALQITVTGLLQGELETREVTVKIKNAKTNNAMWTKQPEQQLMYHGVRVWARRHTPELMLGVQSPEEFDEGPRRPAPPALNVIQSPPLIPTDAPGAAASPADQPAGQEPAPPPVSNPQEDGAGTYSTDDILAFDMDLGNAAKSGMDTLERAWAALPAEVKPLLKAALERRHKKTAKEADDKRAP